MILSKEFLRGTTPINAVVPNEELFLLPEKILQFGTGVLLRGLPDYFVDKANRKGIFNGRIVVVKSTGNGGTADFDDQDSLYTIGIRGIENGENIEENIISSAISRVVSAEKNWGDIIAIAQNPELKIVVSNTTEVGIQLINEDISLNPPKSFPGKLLAVLYQRYEALQADNKAGLVIIATELIPENGKKLEQIVYELADFNGLDPAFIAWSKDNNVFCNSLVDRIVPGKPDPAKLAELEAELGYEDQLLILAEPYRLWAVEGDDRVAAALSFMEADKGLIVKPDIEIYRELKVRLLNGTHTLSCGIAFLAGIDTVRKGMERTDIRTYVEDVMRTEIAVAIPYEVKKEEAIAFSNTVIDRFSNPHIKHLWLSITMQFAMKLKIRILPVLANYYKLYEKEPAHIVFGFAAFLHFMRSEKVAEGKYYGNYNGLEYLITDDSAGYFYEKTTGLNASEYAEAVLTDIAFWNTDLNALPGFVAAVKREYDHIVEKGITDALSEAFSQPLKDIN